MRDLNSTAEIIRQIKEAVISDAQLGVVPWTLTDFSQLHDYVDANMYLEHAGQVYDPDDEASLAEIHLVVDAVSAWMGLGRLAGLQPVRVTWLVIERYALEQAADEWRDQIGIPDGEPITMDAVPVDYLAEIEESEMFVGTDEREVDDVEHEGRREKRRHDPDDVADLVAHDAAVGLPGFTPVPAPPAEGSPEWCHAALMALGGDARAAAVTVADIVQLALARRVTNRPGETDWTPMARAVAGALLDAAHGPGVAYEADALLSWWRELTDEERALTGVELDGTSQA